MSDKRLWGARFEKSMHPDMFNISKSTHFDWRLALIDIIQSSVHLKALKKSEIISSSDYEKLSKALKEIYIDIENRKIQPLATDEDVHTVIERLLENKVGEIGGKIRAGRSRNDQIVTDLKLFLRVSSRQVSNLVIDLISELTKLADKHKKDVAPGFTHLQHAQPVTLGHELMKHCFSLMRDIERFTDWDVRVDHCPLGSAALSGTALISDPMWIANELGFSRPSSNSIDAVSDRDFVSEYLYICASIGIHLSRIAEEIILLTTSEFGYAKLSDEFSTGSSIMPQKKNPDAAEITRGKTGRLIGNLTNILVTSKALPFAYNRDLQEDKEPVFDSHDNLVLMLKSITGTIATLTFDIEKLRSKAIQNHALATEVADYLVIKGLAFAKAHEVTGKCVKYAESKNKEVHELSLSEFQEIDVNFDKDLLDCLNVDKALSSRINTMGTAPDNVAKQVQAVRQELVVLAKWSNHNPVPGLNI